MFPKRKSAEEMVPFLSVTNPIFPPVGSIDSQLPPSPGTALFSSDPALKSSNPEQNIILKRINNVNYQIRNLRFEEVKANQKLWESTPLQCSLDQNERTRGPALRFECLSRSDPKTIQCREIAHLFSSFPHPNPFALALCGSSLRNGSDLKKLTEIAKLNVLGNFWSQNFSNFDRHLQLFSRHFLLCMSLIYLWWSAWPDQHPHLISNVSPSLFLLQDRYWFEFFLSLCFRWVICSIDISMRLTLERGNRRGRACIF